MRIDLLKKIAQDADQPTFTAGYDNPTFPSDGRDPATRVRNYDSPTKVKNHDEATAPGNKKVSPNDATNVIPVKLDENDKPEPKDENDKTTHKTNIDPNLSERWSDKFNPLTKEVISRFKFLDKRIKEIEGMEKSKKIKHLRELSSLRDEFRDLSSKHTSAKFNPETGTFDWGQTKEQEKWEIALLERAGIKYLDYINRGVNSKVYSGIYKEKDIIAKLTISVPDSKLAKMIANVRNAVPANVAKHLINVIDLLTIEDEGDKYFIIITEKLVHANPHIKDLLSNLQLDTQEETLSEGIKTKRRSVENLLTSSDRVFEEMIFNQLNSKVKPKLAAKAKILAPIIKKALFMYSDSFDPNAIIVARNQMKSLIEDNFSDISFIDSETIVTECVKLITNLSKDVQLPGGSKDAYLRDKESHFSALKAMPETKSFINAILYLKNKMGLKAVDLNRKNIMERPVTKDLVLADLGTIIPDL